MRLLLPQFLLVIPLACGILSCTESEKSAKIVIDGELTYGTSDFDKPQITGTVKNVGDATAYNCQLDFSAYSGNTIVDVANGFPANLGDIPVNTSATFEAVFFDLESHSEYDRIATKISCLSR